MNKEILLSNRRIVMDHYKVLINEIRGLKNRSKIKFRKANVSFGREAVETFAKAVKCSKTLAWKRKEARHIFILLNYLKGNPYSIVEDPNTSKFPVDRRLINVLIENMLLDFSYSDLTDLDNWFKGLDSYLARTFGVVPPTPTSDSDSTDSGVPVAA